MFDIGGFLLSFSVESNLITGKIGYILTYRRNTGYLAELFLWRIQKNFKNIFNKKYFLAGGLNKENINEALKFNPYCVDLSGGLETDGIKDFDKMKYIINITKNYKEERI